MRWAALTTRFPPPWSVEELDACFVVTDSTMRCKGLNDAYAQIGCLPSRLSPLHWA
jgi:hypothetical protein